MTAAVARPDTPEARAAIPHRHAPRPDIGRLARELPGVAVLALCSLVLFRDGLFAGRIFYERDTFLFYGPIGRWVAEQLHAGNLPLWIPLIFGGYPVFADGEPGLLYPLNLLLLPILPPAASMTVMRALHLFLAGTFMLAFLRVHGVGRWGALVGGLVFGYGSFFIAQIQHENVVRSATWLPLILLLIELGLRRGGWRRQQYLVLAGLALGIAALGVHVQPVAMTLVALGLYTTYRLLVGPVATRLAERLVLLAWAPGLVAAIGLGIAAVQWLPLFELGRMSYRGPGLGYDLATTWPLRWQNLPTVILPYLFRLDDGRYVTLWQQWETFLYVGIWPLALAAAGVLLVRRRIVPFFLLLAAFGVVVGLAEQSPLNVHRLLWSLPGFSSLRAPGRYAYLIVFGVAALAAFGVDGLTRLRRRSWPVVALGLLATLGGLAATYLIVGLRSRIGDDPVRWKMLIDDYYMTTRHEHEWLTGPLVYQQLVDGLELTNPKTALSVALLLTAGLPILGWALWPRRAGIWGGLVVTVVAADLLLFGYDFHPSAPRAELTAPAPVTRFLQTLGPDARTFADSALKFLEPNRLLDADVPTVAGYSSLQTQRHFEYISGVDSQEDVLLDLWGVRYVVMADPPPDVAIVDGTAYRPFSALFNGAAFNRTGTATFAVEPTPTVELRVLATLIDGVEIEQDSRVAEIVLVAADGTRRTVTLRAGVDVAENAYEREDVRPHLRHARAQVGGTVRDVAPNGQPIQTNVYKTRLPIEPLDVTRVEVRQVYPLGQTRIFGIGLVRPDGNVRSVFSTDRAKFDRIYHEGGIGVFENRAAFPRAYLVPEAVARRGRHEESALPRLAARPFDAYRQVIFEEGPFDGVPIVRPRLGQSLDPNAAPIPATVTDVSTDRVRVRTPDGPGGFLVLTDLYHRGWRARIDGREAPVYIANFLFRGVHVPPGAHTVEFVFDPLSLRVGRAVSYATLAFAAAVLLTPFLARRLRRR
ncbi:MAG: YfhO family protein [Chloroflexota bacterium]|nr:YfhO family protein [Chloroflexota bacterium]